MPSPQGPEEVRGRQPPASASVGASMEKPPVQQKPPVVSAQDRPVEMVVFGNCVITPRTPNLKIRKG